MYIYTTDIIAYIYIDIVINIVNAILSYRSFWTYPVRIKIPHIAKFLFETSICKTFEIYSCEEQRRMNQAIFIFANVGKCSDYKREKGFLRRVDSTNLSQNQTFIKSPLSSYPISPFSPTETKVIAAEMRKTQDIMKELETDFIFVEVDQAIYTKVLDVMFALKNKGEDLFPTTILHMDGFHKSMCMLRTIYSLFKR